MFGRKPRWEDSSVVHGSELAITDEDIAVDTEENCDIQDDMTRIAEYMEYYEFEFDSTQDNIPQPPVDGIPLSDTSDSAHLVSTATPVVPPRPILTIRPLPPPIPIATRPRESTLLKDYSSQIPTAALAAPPYLPPQPNLIPQNYRSSSSLLSSPPPSPEEFQSLLSKLTHSTSKSAISTDELASQGHFTITSLDPVLYTQEERETQIRNVGQWDKMQKKHAKQHTIEVFLPGNSASLKIPREDRVATGNLRVFCCVVKQSRPNRYQLLTKHGLLTNTYTVNTLLRVSSSAQEGINLEIPALPAGNDGADGASVAKTPAIFRKKITLHAVAALDSHSKLVGISGNCKGVCTGRYEHDCGNLCSLVTRTEMAFILCPQIRADDDGESKADGENSLGNPQASNTARGRKRGADIPVPGRRTRQRHK
ncbi:hypothetical protein BDD12DRAFT_810463 [Trichophaea hybrida]|nr:hypothetical protein BDD12DRAFT_810463 [Trichophaea hybrida]